MKDIYYIERHYGLGAWAAIQVKDTRGQAKKAENCLESMIYGFLLVPRHKAKLQKSCALLEK